MPRQGRSRRRRGPTASVYGAWRSAKIGHWDRCLNATQWGNFKPLVLDEIHAAGTGPVRASSAVRRMQCLPHRGSPLGTLAIEVARPVGERYAGTHTGISGADAWRAAEQCFAGRTRSSTSRAHSLHARAYRDHRFDGAPGHILRMLRNRESPIRPAFELNLKMFAYVRNWTQDRLFSSRELA